MDQKLLSETEFAAMAANDQPIFFQRALLLAGSLDPIGPHHVQIIEKLCHLRKQMLLADPRVPVRVIVWPVGPYEGKKQIAPPLIRKEMILAALGHLEGQLEVITYDLDHNLAIGTTTYDMQSRLSYASHTEMREKYFTPLAVPSMVTEVWHVLGADNVDRIEDWDYGADLIKNARFLVMARKGHEPKRELPKGAVLLDFNINGASTDIRGVIKSGEPWEHLVPTGVAEIIKRDGLYGYRTPTGKDKVLQWITSSARSAQKSLSNLSRITLPPK